VKLPYVGTLNASDKLLLQSGKKTLGAFAKQLKQEHNLAHKTGNPPVFKPTVIRYKGSKEYYGSFRKSV
jgi:hypothetical protein